MLKLVIIITTAMAGALGIYGSTMFTALGLNHPFLLVLRVLTLTTVVTTKILEFAALVCSTVIIFVAMSTF